MPMPVNAVDLTRQLIQFDTINPPGNEADCASYLGDLLQQAGFEVTYHNFAEKRTSVIARLGKQTAKRPICFTGHLDTVPLGAARWTYSPLQGEIVDGKMYGRGSSDMKSGVAAFVAAAIGLREVISGSAGVVLVLTAGEETGCEGAFAMAEAEVLGQAGAIVVAEPTANYPLVGHKGAFWLRAHTKGITAHGSMPEHGINAIYKAARAIVALEQMDISPDSHALMGRTTFNVSTIQSGLNHNSVPDAATFGIDIRSVPSHRHDQILERLHQAVGDEVELQPFLDLESVYTDPADPWMQGVFAITEKITGVKPEPRSVAFFTDAAALRRAYQFPPTVILGPGEPHMAHQTDEYCYVQRIEEAVQVYAAIIRQWCNL